MSDITIIKRDGSKEPFDANKINLALMKASEGLPDQISKVVQVASELRLTLFDGMTTEQLDEAVIQTALQNVKDDPDFDTIAARLLLKTMYKTLLGDYETDDELKALHAREFPKYIKQAVKDGNILALVTSRAGLDTSHVGFAVWKKDGLHLFHASSLQKKVVEDKSLLRSYMKKQKSQLGIRVVKVK